MNNMLSQYRAVWASRNARLVLGSDALSKAGDWFMYVAMSLLIYDGGGAAALGIFSVLRIGVPILVGPVAGRWGNSRHPRTIMIVCDLARTAVIGVGAAAAAWNAPVTILMAVPVLSAGFTAAFAPAERRLHRDLVQPEDRAALNSTLGTSGTSVIVLAPALAGALAASLGVPWLLAINAASFLASAALITRLNRVEMSDAPAPESNQHSKTGTNRQGLWREVLTLMKADRFVTICLCCQIIACLVASASLVLQVPVADQAGNTTALLGWLTTGIGVGSVLGMVVGGIVAKQNRLIPGAACAVLLCLSVGLFASSTNPVTALASAVAMGFMASTPESLYWTSFQNRVPKEHSGTFFGFVESTTTAAMALGGVAAGTCAAMFGTQTGGWVIASAVGVLALGCLVLAARARHSDAVPAPETPAEAKTVAA